MGTVADDGGERYGGLTNRSWLIYGAFVLVGFAVMMAVMMRNPSEFSDSYPRLDMHGDKTGIMRDQEQARAAREQTMKLGQTER